MASLPEPCWDAGGVVLQKLSDQIRACHERAAEARDKAEATSVPALKADYLAAADRWIVLARDYELTDRVTDVTGTVSDKLRKQREVAQADDALLLQEISTSLIQEGDIHALYERILDGAMHLMSAPMGSMQAVDPDRNELRLLAWRGFHPESAAFWDRINLDSVHTSCGVAFLSGHRIIVPDTEACDFIAGSADLEHYHLSNIRSMQSTPLISRSGQMLGMISTEWREPHQPSEHTLRSFDVLARQAADLIERTRAETALRESDERYRQIAAIVQSSDDAIIGKDLDGIITSWNKGAERIYGHSAEEAIGAPVTIIMPPDRHDEEPEILERVRRGERIEPYETIRQRKHGSRIDVSLTVSAVRNIEGKIVGASMVSRDISERKRAEERIAALAREAEHRTKNILATVQATIQLSHADTPVALKRAIEGRLHALANCHALFVESRWTGADVRDLVMQELLPYSQGDETRALVRGPDVLLEPNAAQAIAMIVHELATNAAKYGAFSTPKGHVKTEWMREPTGRFVLRWTEGGGPLVNNQPTRKGFGTLLMSRMIKSLKGETNFEWREEGLHVEIAIP